MTMLSALTPMLPLKFFGIGNNSRNWLGFAICGEYTNYRPEARIYGDWRLAVARRENDLPPR
jgi:hypothetical protein